jgi:protein TonB
VKVAQAVEQTLLISKIVPEYPPLARQAHVTGSVLLEAEISKDGSVEDLRVISGHPLLLSAAIEAVKQWRYKPYMVGGERVPVSTQVEISFSLSGG